MPYVNIKLAGTATKEQKKELIEGTTKLLEEVMSKPPSATYVVIDEVETDNWGKGGKTITEIRTESKS